MVAFNRTCHQLAKVSNLIRLELTELVQVRPPFFLEIGTRPRFGHLELIPEIDEVLFSFGVADLIES